MLGGAASAHCWAPGSVSLPATGSGPLDGVTVAVKDMFAIAGHVPPSATPGGGRRIPPARRQRRPCPGCWPPARPWLGWPPGPARVLTDRQRRRRYPAAELAVSGPVHGRIIIGTGRCRGGRAGRYRPGHGYRRLDPGSRRVVRAFRLPAESRPGQLTGSPAAGPVVRRGGHPGPRRPAAGPGAGGAGHVRRGLARGGRPHGARARRGPGRGQPRIVRGGPGHRGGHLGRVGLRGVGVLVRRVHQR